MVDRTRSRQAFLLQRDNALAGIAPVASGVAAAAAQDVVFPALPVRAGEGDSTGSVVIGGVWSEDRPLDLRVRITNTPASTRRISSERRGVGNGTLTGLDVANTVDPQTVTLRLIDLGIDTEYATAVFCGVPIKAQVAGDDGNNIRIEVDTSGLSLTLAATIPEDAGKDQDIFDAAGWDFGAKPLSTSGQMHPDTPRLSFDPFGAVVYRQYEVNDASKQTIVFDPPLADDFEAGARVWAVTGPYVVSVIYDNGVDPATTEAYTGITVFDIVSQMLASNLIEVDTVLLQNRRPGGIAATDVSLRTQPYILSTRYDGDGRFPGALDAVTLNDPQSEQITLECVEAATLNAEKWRVRGGVSGSLGVAVTGEAFTSTTIDFTVPQIGSETRIPTEQPRITATEFATGDVVTDDESGEIISSGSGPEICLYDYALYERARSAVLTFTYVVPAVGEDPAGCDCANGELFGSLEGGQRDTLAGGSSMGTLTGDLKTKVDGIASWIADFTEAETVLTDGGVANSKVIDDGTAGSSLVRSVGTAFVEAYRTLYQDLTGADLTAAVAQMDTAFSDIQTYLNGQLSGAGYFINSNSGASHILLRVRDAINEAYVKGGIDPFDSGGFTDDTRQQIDGPYFEVRDASGRSYEPMLRIGDPWYARRAEFDETGRRVIIDTREFGLQFRGDCLDRLRAGDTFEVTIGIATEREGYAAGEIITITTARARELECQGGITGDNTHTWAVQGGDGLARPNYVVIHGSETTYQDSLVDPADAEGIDFLATRGSVANQLNDQWLLYVSGEQYEISTDGGSSWSSAADVHTTSQPVPGVTGLTVRFVDGPGVSFAPDDAFAFDVRQPGQSAYALAPGSDAWALASGAQTLTVDLGSDTDIGTLALLWYSIPAGRAVTLELLSAADAVLYTTGAVAVTALQRPIVAIPDDPISARKVRLSVDDGADCRVNWLWCGAPVQFSSDANSCEISQRRLMARIDGPSLEAIPIGIGFGARLSWSYASGSTVPLNDDDCLLADQMYVDLTTAGDQQIGFIPNVEAPRGYLMRWSADSYTIADDMEYNADPGVEILRALEIDLAPVLL